MSENVWDRVEQEYGWGHVLGEAVERGRALERVRVYLLVIQNQDGRRPIITDRNGLLDALDALTALTPNPEGT